MNTLQIAYKILYSLEHKKKADYMGQLISPTKLGVSEQDWLDVIEMLQDAGYIKGAVITSDILGNQQVNIKNVKITLAGAEYLHENSSMQKIAKVATDIIEVAANIAGIPSGND